MSARESGGPAFPGTEANGLNSGWSGMDLRDYFAAKVVQGLLAEPFVPGTESTASVLNGHGVGNQSEVASHYARAAYILADAMLKARTA